jgi:hypothetical protein
MPALVIKLLSDGTFLTSFPLPGMHLQAAPGTAKRKKSRGFASQLAESGAKTAKGSGGKK